jgi:DNA repair exonuclease SbcCD nuclease subunit
MLGMTTHDEKLTRVRIELMYLMADRNFEKVFDILFKKMNEVGDGSGRLKQLYDEVKPFIPANSAYEERDWVAAYIIYSNLTKFKEFFQKLNNVKSNIKNLNDELKRLRRLRSLIKRQLDVLNFTLDTTDNSGGETRKLQLEIEVHKNMLRKVRDANNKTLRNHCDLKNEKKKILREMKEFTRQLVVS